MSFEAMKWAVGQKLPATQKLVLLILANRLNGSTGQCNPSIAGLAQDCSLSESACKVAIRALKERGLIEVIHQSRPSGRVANQYRLHLRDDHTLSTSCAPPLQPPEVLRGGHQEAMEPGKEKQEGIQSVPSEVSKSGLDGPRPGSMSIKELIDEGIPESTAKDWLTVRRAKKAVLTPSAWAAVKREAAMAGISPAEAVRHAAENSWQGFKAAWLQREGHRGSAEDIFAGAK
jgi:hypothetical protein